ncbi:hypothetical protein K883_05159 [Mycobacterium sp. TKK-01-0059]|nr:hypothetical protein K883_05159 [Mycobacterium sp. TKK-01-0059]
MKSRNLENQTAEALLTRIKELAADAETHLLPDLANAYVAVVAKSPIPNRRLGRIR